MATERSAQQREPLDLDGLITTLREWADKIEGDPSGIVAFLVGRPGCVVVMEACCGAHTSGGSSQHRATRCG